MYYECIVLFLDDNNFKKSRNGKFVIGFTLAVVHKSNVNYPNFKIHNKYTSNITLVDAPEIRRRRRYLVEQYQR